MRDDLEPEGMSAGLELGQAWTWKYMNQPVTWGLRSWLVVVGSWFCTWSGQGPGYVCWSWT